MAVIFISVLMRRRSAFQQRSDPFSQSTPLTIGIDIKRSF